MAADTQIIGMADLTKKFAALKELGRGARRAVLAAAQVLRSEAKSLARQQGLLRTGALIRNIAIKRERTPESLVQYHLGVRHGRDLTRKQKSTGRVTVNKAGRIVKRYENDPYYWRFHELGYKWVPRASGQAGSGVTVYYQRLRNGKLHKRSKKWRADSITGRRRAATKTVPARPFIAPALANKKREALDALVRALDAEIQRQARR
jgi:HK97 gp10 family phage protein